MKEKADSNEGNYCDDETDIANCIDVAGTIFVI